MSVEVKNLAEFDATVIGWLKAVENVAREAALGLAHNAFEEILETAPQYSGDFVANTRYAIGAPDTTFEEGLGGGKMHDPKQMGDSQAQNVARSRVRWRKPQLGESIFVSSSAKHDELYAWKIENGQIALRPVNEGADHIYRRAAANTGHKFSRIGSVQLAALRKATR